MADAFASDFDETDVFDDTSLSLAQDSFAVEGSARPTGLTLAEAGSFEDADTALSGLGSFVKQQQGQGRALALASAEAGDFSGLSNVDINKLRQNPRKTTKDYYKKEVDTNVVSYVNDNDIPSYKEIDGVKYFLNTGTQNSITSVAGDDHVNGGHYEAYGPVGSYSAQWVEDPSSFQEFVNNPIINVMAAAIPGGKLALLAIKAAGGESLSPMEVVTLVAGGLKMSGVFSGETAAAAGTIADNTVEDAIAAGTVTTVDQANALREATLANLQIAPEILGTPINDILGLATGDTSIDDLMGSSILAPAVDAAKNTVPEGVLVNLMQDAVDGGVSSIGQLVTLANYADEVRISNLEADAADAADLATRESGYLNATGVTPDNPETVVDAITGDLDKEPIINEFEFDPELDRPTVDEVIETPETTDTTDNGGGDTGGGDTGGDTGGAGGAGDVGGGDTGGGDTGGGTDAVGGADDIAGGSQVDSEIGDGNEDAAGNQTGGGTYKGVILVDADGNRTRWDDREILEDTLVITSSDDAEWGRSGTWQVRIGDLIYDIDWKNGTYSSDVPEDFYLTEEEIADQMSTDSGSTPAETGTGDDTDSGDEDDDDKQVIDVLDIFNDTTDVFTGGGGVDTDTTGGGLDTDTSNTTGDTGDTDTTGGGGDTGIGGGGDTNTTGGGGDTGTGGGGDTDTGGGGDTGTGGGGDTSGTGGGGDTSGTGGGGDTSGGGGGDTGTGGGDGGDGDGGDGGTGGGDGGGDGTGSGSGSGSGTGGGSGGGSGSGIGYGAGSPTEALFGDMLKLKKPVSTQQLLQFGTPPEAAQGMMSPNARNDILLEFIQANPNAGMLANLQRNRR